MLLEALQDVEAIANDMEASDWYDDLTQIKEILNVVQQAIQATTD